MKGSLLGAVGAPCLLLSAHPTWDGGEAAARHHRLNLERQGGERRRRWGGGRETRKTGRMTGSERKRKQWDSEGKEEGEGEIFKIKYHTTSCGTVQQDWMCPDLLGQVATLETAPQLLLLSCVLLCMCYSAAGSGVTCKAESEAIIHSAYRLLQ